MKRPSLLVKRSDDKVSVATSVAIHVVLIALIASITFRYPIASFFGIDHDATPPTIHFVKVQPPPREAVGNGSDVTKKRDPKKQLNPARLMAPTVIPTTIPAAPPAASVGAISGTSTGSGGAPVGLATGVEPALPDSRLDLKPSSLRLPMTQAERNDSAVKAIFLAYREAEIEAEEHKGRDPRDWTFKKGDQKYGVDSSYIYLGKFKIPSAVLAALPFNHGGVDGTRITENRNAAWIQNDIFTHAQGMTEDDFRAAVQRIRARKDREKKEDEDAKTHAQTSPIVP